MNSNDQPPPDPNLPELLAQAMAHSVVSLSQRRVGELGVLLLSAAEAGLSASVIQVFKDKKKPESKTVSVVVALSGAIPDDCVAMLQDYVKGLVQDYTAGDKTLTVLHRSDDPNQP